MHATYRVPELCEYSAIDKMLANQFGHGNTDQFSLCVRYPDVFGPGNRKAVLSAWVGDELAGALARSQHRFPTEAAGEAIGTMIGFVCVTPKYRRSGLGTSLMKHAADLAAGSGADFAVLWTNQPSFYSRLGWSLQDPGAVAAWPLPSSTLLAARAAGPGNSPESAAPRLGRPLPASPTRLPLPYASVGTINRSVVGEIAGDEHLTVGFVSGGADIIDISPNGVELLTRLRELPGHKTEVRVFRQLVGEEPPTPPWNRDAKAMWLPLSDAGATINFSSWYVPVLYRI